MSRHPLRLKLDPMPYSTDPNDYQRVPIKVAAMAKDFPAGFNTGEHAHERAQLVYAVSGVMRVTTRDGTWVVPTHRAVWVPPGEPHAIRMSGAVAMRTLYIAKDATRGLPKAWRLQAVQAVYTQPQFVVWSPDQASRVLYDECVGAARSRNAAKKG